MKKLRSYSSVWKVEQVIYSFGDAKLPTPVTVTQLLWLAVSGVLVFMFRKVPPLVLIHNPLILYGIPFGVTWFMSKKTFDGKKPYSFLKSQITFVLRPKVTYAGKAIKLKHEKFNPVITAVRSVMYVPD
mgnify:CR=1 FL=1